MTVSRWQQRVDVLGPVIVRGAGGIVPLTRSMEIAVLSLLALRAGSPVSGDSLIDLLWPDDPPRTAGKTLQGYVKRVRSMVAVNGIDLSHAGPRRLRAGPRARRGGCAAVRGSRRARADQHR